MGTHFASLQGQVRTAASSGGVGEPAGNTTGDLWYDTDHNCLMIWNGTAWMGRAMTSTSTSTTTTSSSTTTS